MTFRSMWRSGIWGLPRVAWASVFIAVVMSFNVMTAFANSEGRPEQPAVAYGVVNVVEQTIGTAPSALAQNVSIPGNAKDGSHFVVRTGCVTKAEFVRIKVGMTVSQVARIFGTKGVNAGEEGNDDNVAHRVYPSCSTSGAAEAFFVNGRLTRKYWI